ncbi:MAG: phosphatase domain-containing protein [Chitinophagaceae bacterium]
MSNKIQNSSVSIKVYHGYGHTHNLVLYGHVFKHRPIIRSVYTNNIPANIMHLLRLFFVKPLSGISLTLQWNATLLHSTTQEDGFFKFEWKSEIEVEAGWHPVSVTTRGELGQVGSSGQGKIFVPHKTQFAFISDIDDTVLISHSATIGKRLKVLFTKNPRTRQAFEHVATYYNLLALSRTTQEVPNPFFYVSSSEWNLYDYLADFFEYNKLPEGIFLLNQIKQWFQLFKTGKTQHDGKLIRVLRILDAFPQQQFVLLGDNSQKDPAIYSSIALKYPEKIFAVYIRNVRPANENNTNDLLSALADKGVYTCLFKHNSEAIAHSKSIGLILE